MAVTVKLSKPFEFAGETVSEITLKEPTVKDIRKCGYPFTVVASNGGSQVKFDTEAIFTYISRLGQIPPAILENNLSMADFTKLQTEVINFFGSLGE